MSSPESVKQGDKAKPTRGYGFPKWLPLVRVLKIASRIPNWAWRPIARLSARWACFRRYKAVRQWELNAEVMLGRPVTRAESRSGVYSWFENMIGSVQLGKYSPEQNMKRVLVDPEGLDMLRHYWRTTGVVVALPHMGDWDLCGAYVCAHGIPVSSVAERLPDDEFAYFMAIRKKVGLRIYSHKDHDSVHKLSQDIADGRVVALLADRDLSRHGVPVVWNTRSGPQQVTMPPGPALLAQRTGATLLVAISTFQGSKMHLHFRGPVTVDPGEAGLQTTSQRLADIFCEEVALRVRDWHLMQRFFPGVLAE